MYGFRSARGRTIAAGLALTFLLVSITAFTIWRTQNDNRQLHELERASDAATVLEHARAQLLLQTSLLSALAFTQDPGFVSQYSDAQAALEQDLIVARTEATNRGDGEQLAILDDLTLRMADFEDVANRVIPLVLSIDSPQAVQATAAYQPEIAAHIDAMYADLDRLALDAHEDMAAERGAMDRQADVTFWFIVGRSVIAFVLTAGLAAIVILSILRPLASVRLSARAIAAGNLSARARVFGPEEVASLARDFNRMTDALAAKTDEYITTTNLTGDIIGKVDSQGRWSLLNDAACQFLGKPRERLLGTAATAVLHPDDLESTAQTLSEARLKREPIRGLVNRMITPIGTRVVEWNAYPLFDERGGDAGFQITGRDITERKQAEEALRQSEEKYRELIENINEVVYALDADGVVTYVSPAVERLGGYSPSEVIGHSLTEFIHPDDLLPLMQSFQKTVSGDPEPFEYRILSKAGDAHWVLTFSRLVKKGERIVGVRAVLMDITDRKHAEEALRESEENYRKLVEDSIDGLVIIEGTQVRFANPAALDMLGYDSQEEAAGRPFTDFASPEYRDLMLERALARQRGEDPPSRYAIKALRKDGSEFPAEMSIGKIVYKGRMALQAIVRDITERHRSEEHLRQAEQRYRELFEEAPAMYVICRDGGGIPLVNDCNDLFLTTLGYSLDEVVGRPVADFYTPESRELLAGGAFQRALVGQFVEEERQLVTKDGRIVETMLRAVPEAGPDGHVRGTRAMYLDITERKQVERAARESEARYRLLAENTTDLIWTMDLGLRYTYMSPAVTRMRGYSVEEIIGTTVQDTMTPASLEVARKCLAEELAIERGGKADPNRSTQLELEMYCKDGSTIWTEMNMTFLRDADGRPTGILGVTRDISERKRSEEALEESERRYRLIAECATDLIWTTDMSLRYTYISPSVLRLRGYTPEEAAEHKIEEDLCPSSLHVAMRALAEETERDRTANKAPYRWRTLELEHYCKDGSTVWLEVSVTFLRDEDGQLVGLLGSSRDISERRRAEAALEESERRHRLLAENASDIIWTMDMNLRFTYESPSVTRIRGYTPEEAMALTIEETLTPDSLDLARRVLAEELAPGKMEAGDFSRSRTLELEHTCKDGSTIWLEVTTTFLRDEDGQLVGLLGSSRDISERRAAAVALEESEKRYRLLAENVSDVIFTTDLGLRYTYVSPSVTRMRGYTVEEVMSSSLADSLAPHSLEQARKVIADELINERAGKRAPSRTVEVELNRKDGSTIWAEVTATFLRDADGKPVGLLGVSRDISERKRAEEERTRLHTELEARAVTDSLTGLYNHAYFYQRLGDEIDRAKRYDHCFALVMMDVDAFKHYNDSRGHQAGDAALRLIGECVRSAMRRSDLAFRYGGDEFVALLLDANVARAQNVVRRINKRIASRLKEMGDSAGGWLGVSAGIACFPADAASPDELVGMADAAMYDAKRLVWARGVIGQRHPVEATAAPVSTFQDAQSRVLAGAASSLSAALQDLAGPARLTESELRTMATLGATAEIRDPFIRGHQERTSRLAASVAKAMGLGPESVRNLSTAGLLHDLGKVNVGESILNKPGKLSDSESAMMKEHAAFGASMIFSASKALRPLAPIVRHHHECVDGSGYPDGLARENIPLEARILSVADAFDAMTHERAYRKALSTEEALGEIQRGAGTRFDQAVVQAFLGVMMKRHGGEPG